MKKRVFPANTECFPDISDFVESILDEAGSSMKATMQILIALEEVFVNIASYAYEDGDGDVTVSISIENDICKIMLEDSGKPFNPLEKPDPDLSVEAQEECIGGLGIYMVKKTMDSVAYSHIDNKNTLTFTKSIL